MSHEEIQNVTIEEMFKMAQQKKTQGDGRGVGLWFISWGLIAFGFEQYVGLADWPMWMCRIVGLFLLLIGTFSLSISFEGRRIVER